MMQRRQRARILAVAAMMVGAMLAAVAVPQAEASLIEFESAAAVAANEPVPPVPAKPLEEAKEACGSETSTWGSELLTTPLNQIKVKNEWADLVPGGKEMMVSGTVHNLETPGGDDVPIDHPFSNDTTFDVELDEPYWSLARELTAESEGKPSKHELHMELETGAFPHSMPAFGPAEGQPWDLLPSEVTEREERGESTATLVEGASIGLESGYIPQEGDRIAIRGRWILDCGHNDFHGELHPITFMAFGHPEGSKTVVHVLANAYRVTQLYGNGTGEVNSPPTGQPFPAGLENAVTTLVARSIFGTSPSPLSLPVGIERTLPSTAPVKMCAPESDTGLLSVSYAFERRKAVGLMLKAAKTRRNRCAKLIATIHATEYKAFQPRSRTCVMPWPWLNARIAEALGVSGLRSSEVESIKVNATGGTFTITYGGNTTNAIPYNASASEVQEALDGLPGVEPGDITVVGGPGGAGGEHPYTLIFGGELAEQSITPVTTDRSELTGGAKLASVVVLRPGGPLDLRRFILSTIEQQEKVALEEKGQFASIAKIESNMALNPQAACLDPLSAPALNFEKHRTTSNMQPFPYYGEVNVELK